jgi:hypothetical protein
VFLALLGVLFFFWVLGISWKGGGVGLLPLAAPVLGTDTLAGDRLAGALRSGLRQAETAGGVQLYF